MFLRLAGHTDLPSDAKPARYGRPALDLDSARLYIPVMDEDALWVVDCNQNRYVHAIRHLPGVSTVLAPEQANVLLATAPATSQVMALDPGQDRVVATLAVGGRPQELAYDASRGHLLVAFAGRREDTGDFNIAVVDIQRQMIIGDMRVPGPTRHVLYDRQSDMFYVVVTDPAQVIVLAADSPTRVAHAFEVEAHGLRSMAVGPQGTRLFCACDDSSVVTVDRRSGRLLSRTATRGVPDSLLYSPIRGHLYVTIGERGLIEIFDTVLMESLGTYETEAGAGHLAFDPVRHKLYVLLPESRRVGVYVAIE